MAGSKSNWCELQVLDYLVGYSAASPSPVLSATLYVALYTTIIDDTTLADDAGEAVGYGGYTRQAIPPGSADWEDETIAVDQNRVKNVGQVLFPSKSDAGSITIQSVAVVTSGPAIGTAGNVLFYDNGSGSGLGVVVSQGEQPQIPIGQLIHEEQ